MLIGFLSEVQKRDGNPAKGIVLVRLLITFCFAQLLGFSGFLSSQWLASFFNFSLSSILNIAGINNTWHKRMLTTEAKALYVEHEYILLISLIVFSANLLWLQGKIKKQLLCLAGGIAALYITHLLCYSLMLFFAVSNALFYCTEFAVIFMMLYFYVKPRLVKQAF